MVELTSIPAAGGVGSGGAVQPRVELAAQRNPLAGFVDFVLNQQAQKAKDDEFADGLRLSEAQAEYNRRATEFQAELDPLDPEFNSKLDEGLASIADEVGSEFQMANPQNQERLGSALRVRTSNFQTAAGSQRRNALDTEAQRILGRELDLARSRISADPGGVDAYRAEFESQMATFVPDLRPEQVQAFLDEASVSLELALVDGLAQEGDFEQAKATLGLLRDNLSPDEFERQQRRLNDFREGRARQAAENGAEARAQISAQVDLAETMDDLDAAQRLFEDAVQSGAFVGKDSERVVLARDFEKRRREIVTAQRERSDLYVQQRSGVLLENQKDVDTAWAVHQEVAARNGRDLTDPAVILEEATAFSRVSGQVPSQVRGILAGAEMSDDPQRIAQAAVVDGQLSRANRFTDTGAGARVKRTRSLMETFSVNPQEAAALVLRAEEPAVVARRAEQLGTKDFKLTDTEAREQAAGAGGTRFLGAVNRFGTEQVSDQAVADYTQLYNEAFMLTGSKDDAKKIATARFSEVYGASSVGGTERLVQFPPEQFIPVPGLSPDEAASALDEELSARFVDANGQPIPNITLVAAPDAKARVAAGLPPIYNVMAPSARLGGVLAPLVGAQGQPVTFQMPPAGDFEARNSVVRGRSGPKAALRNRRIGNANAAARQQEAKGAFSLDRTIQRETNR